MGPAWGGCAAGGVLALVAGYMLDSDVLLGYSLGIGVVCFYWWLWEGLA